MKAYELLDSPDKWSPKGTGRYNDVTHKKETWCVISALAECYNDHDGESSAYERIVALLGARYEDRVGQWNDAPGRTWEDVHNLLVEADV